MKEKIIYLPIEIKSREFDSKVLIAINSAKNGATAVVSTRGFVNNLKNKPNGVVLAKSAARFEIDTILKHKEYGNKYCVLDEEGIVHVSKKEGAMRFSQNTLEVLDRILLNGSHELDIVDEFFSIPENKTVLVGNSRFDYYKIPLSYTMNNESKLKQDKYGKYILILSRFGEANFIQQKTIGILDYIKSLGYLSTDEDIQIWEKFVSFSEEVFSIFISMLPTLSKQFSDYTIIVRPHPSELIDTWIDAANGLDNVKVIREGAVGPWIQGSEFIIHNGCTTAIESYLLEKPVISYMPIKSEELDLHIANKMGVECNSVEDVVKVGKDILNGSYSRPSVDDELKKYLFNTDVFAYENITKELLSLANEIQSPKKGKLSINPIKKLIKKLRLRRNKKIHNTKFPYTTLKEVKEKKDNICKALGMDSTEIKVKELDYNAFLFYKKHN